MELLEVELYALDAVDTEDANAIKLDLRLAFHPNPELLLLARPPRPRRPPRTSAGGPWLPSARTPREAPEQGPAEYSMAGCPVSLFNVRTKRWETPRVVLDGQPLRIDSPRDYLMGGEMRLRLRIDARPSRIRYIRRFAAADAPLKPEIRTGASLAQSGAVRGQTAWGRSPDPDAKHKDLLEAQFLDPRTNDRRQVTLLAQIVHLEAHLEKRGQMEDGDD